MRAFIQLVSSTQILMCAVMRHPHTFLHKELMVNLRFCIAGDSSFSAAYKNMFSFCVQVKNYG